jgi:hypothetical protein
MSTGADKPPNRFISPKSPSASSGLVISVDPRAGGMSISRVVEGGGEKLVHVEESQELSLRK